MYESISITVLMQKYDYIFNEFIMITKKSIVIFHLSVSISVSLSVSALLENLSDYALA